MMLAKIAGAAAAASLCLSMFAVPASAENMHPASKADILKHLGPNAAGKTDANGYTYKPGSAKGYKVSNGSICIRSPDGSVGCAKIITDGSKFMMMTSDGARAPF